MMNSASYRPRNPGHDYYGRGTYLVTLVVSGREALLGQLVGDAAHPGVQLSAVGEMVRQIWELTPKKLEAHGNRVAVHACVCMPDHFHGVIEVLEPMQWSLGDIIQAFKASCTSRWQQQWFAKSANRPISADCSRPEVPEWLREKPNITVLKGHWCAAFQKSSGESIMPWCNGKTGRSLTKITMTPYALTIDTEKP